MIGAMGESRQSRESVSWESGTMRRGLKQFFSLSNLILEHGITAWGDGKLTAMAGIQEKGNSRIILNLILFSKQFNDGQFCLYHGLFISSPACLGGTKH